MRKASRWGRHSKNPKKHWEKLNLVIGRWLYAVFTC